MPLPNIAPDLRYVLDRVRSIGGQLGLRDGKNAIVRQVTEARSRAEDDGTITWTDTLITFSGSNPLFTRVTGRDVARGQGRYKDGDYRLGPITPVYTSSLGYTGGYPTTVWEPAEVTDPNVKRSVIVNLKGFSMLPVSGSWFKITDVDQDSTLHYYLVLRRTEETF